MTDKDLIELYFEEGKTNYAFNLMVRNYSQRLYWHIRRLVHVHEDADDVLQNTFIKIWKGLPSFKRESALFSWMYRIATNEAINFIKANKKHQNNLKEFNAEWIKDDPYFDGDEAYILFMKAVNQLPEKQKLVFNMKYFQDLKYSEISEILGNSEGGLKASYHHATKKIESFLKDN
jgi:RNA polymerase sigma-70 factor (ECF subfamily)